ncbi:MAG: sulfur carrier protein ThiS [Gammaproteobacteria bacterium]
MNTLINGTPTELPEGLTVAQLLDRLELGGKRLAVEVNEDIIPRSTFDQHIIEDGDRIEIVRAIGGG